MSDVERALLSKVAQDGSLEQLVAMGIRDDHFGDPECGGLYGAMVEHLRRYRTVPDYKTVRTFTYKVGSQTKSASSFPFSIETQALEYFTDRFRAEVNRRVADQHIVRAAQIVGEGKQDEMLNLGDMLLGIAHEVIRAIPAPAVSSFAHGMHGRIADYRRREREGQVLGIVSSFPTIDDKTFGIQKGNYVTIAGWQGTGKSTLGAKFCFEGWKQEKTSIIFSLEMSAEAINRKLDNMAQNAAAEAQKMIRYHDIKALSLSDEELRYWERLADAADNSKADIVILDDVGRCTPERVEAEIIRRKPDLCMVDYVTLMDVPSSRSSAMWESVTYLTRNLKGTARATGCPIIGIAQTNIDSAEDGAKLQNIAYSRSIGQDSDLVFGLFQNEEMRMNSQMLLRLLKNRDDDICEVPLYWNMPTMVFREWIDGVDTFQPKTEFLKQVEAGAKP